MTHSVTRDNQKADRRSTPVRLLSALHIINCQKSACNMYVPMVTYDSRKRKHTMITEANTFICTCHGLPAWFESDARLPHWVCDVDDKVCEVVKGVA